jgi:putative redox protein
MAEKMTARVRLGTELQFEGVAGSGHYVALDAAEQAGGRTAGFHPMELLLLGLAGCTAMDVIAILRRLGQDMTGYEVQVRGQRAEAHPMAFTQITVTHLLSGPDLDPAAVRQAIGLSQTHYSGAEDMLGRTARIEHTYRIHEVGDVPDDIIVIP